MYRVYACLTAEHDLRLVLVAGLVCLLASRTCLSLARRGAGDLSRARLAWIGGAALVAGCGIWATHFIAMLAFSTGLPTGYDVGLTLLSVLVAVLGGAAGFSLAAKAEGPRLCLAGAVVGASVGAMHFTGMAAVRVPALMTWDLGLAAAALVAGVALGAAAVRVALGSAGSMSMTLGALLLTVGICALHFTAMGALRLEPSPLVPGPVEHFSSEWLALGVAAAAAIVLSTASIGLIIDHKLARRTAREAERLQALVNATFEGILIETDGVIVDSNESLARLIGCQIDELIGRPSSELLGSDDARMNAQGALDHTSSMAVQVELARRDGTLVSVELLGRPIDYEGRAARVVAVRDITERRAAEKRIQQLAYYDVLTGLPNRVLFSQHAQRALARAESGSLALLCLDLDRFKGVNDTLGHPVGDGLLRAVAQRLQACVRETDLVARLGGDEFAIIQERASQPDAASALARRVVDALSMPFEIEGHQIVVGSSIGVALGEDTTADSDALLKCADLALYRAKADGGGTWRFFEAEMDARTRARRALEMELRQALSLDQLEVFYQPLVGAAGKQVSGFEALLRWHHPERGTVSPALFIPLAEEIGLIGQIGAWVLRRACADAASWPVHLKVAVNLSPVQFRTPALAREVGQALADSGLDPSRLELEVTESVLLGNNANVLAELHKLRGLGVRIAMDDFGTGYSSLSYLRQFPFDKIKIDQSFVRGMVDHDDCAAIVRAVIGLGRSLGIAVNAEGVETAQQLAALRAEGCGEVQGYLFSKARSASDIPALLLEHELAWSEDGRGERSAGDAELALADG